MNRHYSILNRLPVSLVCCLLLATTAACWSMNTVRVKDVTRLKGQEQFTLIGYGLIVGLDGTGDSDEELTQRTIYNLLENFQIKVDLDNLKAENTAAVMVSSTVKYPAHKGDMVETTVSSIGDAASLKGGELLLTPLLDTSGEMAAVAQGAVTTGGFTYGGDSGGGQQVTRNHPTVGMLTNGSKLVKGFPGEPIGKNGRLVFFLEQPDYTTAANMTEAINKEFPGSAFAENDSSVRINIPRNYQLENSVSEFISEIQQVEFKPDTEARVVFNERTGTIVFGSKVRISEVAVSHGNLTITVTNQQGVSQPEAFSDGETTVVENQQTDVREDEMSLTVLPETTTIGELVNVLNTLGVTPRDMMVIFHVLKKAGALHATLETI